MLTNFSKLLTIFLVSLIISCTENKNKGESKLMFDSAPEESELVESALNNTEKSTVQEDTIASIEEEECVFDTSSYKFTSEAIRKFDKKLAFHWDKASERAFVKLNATDSLILHIGGCNHFSFDATFITDASKFNDRHYLFEKTKWLAQTFFGNGFDEKYVYCISNKLYNRSETEEENFQHYTIIDPDTSMTDHIYEGWSFEKVGTSTKINILGYTN